jgi:hypothetical protein
MSPLPATPADWLFRAAEARDLADTLNDPMVRRTMLLIARGYERLAESARCLERLNLPTEPPQVEPWE